MMLTLWKREMFGGRHWWWKAIAAVAMCVVLFALFKLGYRALVWSFRVNWVVCFYYQRLLLCGWALWAVWMAHQRRSETRHLMITSVSTRQIALAKALAPMLVPFFMLMIFEINEMIQMWRIDPCLVSGIAGHDLKNTFATAGLLRQNTHECFVLCVIFVVGWLVYFPALGALVQWFAVKSRSTVTASLAMISIIFTHHLSFNWSVNWLKVHSLIQTSLRDFMPKADMIFSVETAMVAFWTIVLPLAWLIWWWLWARRGFERAVLRDA